MLASAVGLGLAAGLATGGRLSRLAELQVAWWPILAAGVLLRLSAGYAGDAARALYLAGFVAIVIVAVANRRLPGALLIAAGAALNLMVVVVNGAMPVSADAIAAVGGSFPTDPLHTTLVADSRLPLLSDIIPFPVVRTAYSAGDVLIALGGARLTFWALRRA